MIEDILVILGAFLGCFANIIVKWRIKTYEFRNLGNYVIALILSFAVYGLYYYLKTEQLIPSHFPFFALFCFSLFLGYALDEIANDILSLIKKKA